MRPASRGGGAAGHRGVGSLSRKQKNLYEDLQMRLSENIDRPPPLSVKEQREAARRGALYGQNPTNLFRKPKLKRPKSAPFGGIVQDPNYVDPASRIVESAAEGRLYHADDWKNIGCGRDGAVWALTEPKEHDLRKDLPPEDWRPTITGPPRDWPSVTIASKANTEANAHADVTGRHANEIPGKPKWIVTGTPTFDKGGWYKFSPRSRRNLAKGFTRSTPLSKSLPSSSFETWAEMEKKKELIATYSSFNLTKRPPSTPLRSAKSRKSLGTPKRSRRAQTATGSRRRRPSQGSRGSRPSTTTGHRASRAMLPLSPGARRRLAKPPTLETPLGEDAYKCREIVENEQLAMAQLLTHTYGHNPKNTEPAPLGRFAKETISRSKQCRLHRNWLKNKRRVDCNQCLRKNQHFTSVMNATKHGDPPITVAGATKKRSKARKVYMPSGATIMHSTSLRRNDVVALLAAKGVEADKRRALRPSCIAFMTSHRTFLRLDFGEVLRASRQRVKADESDHRNLFKDETNAAVDEWLAANNLSNKTPAYLTRGQFIRVMRNFGFDSKEDMREMNRMFSSYDVHARDYVDMNIFCTGFLRYQTKVRALRFGKQAGRGEMGEAAAMGGANVAEMLTQKTTTASDERRQPLNVIDFYPND